MSHKSTLIKNHILKNAKTYFPDLGERYSVMVTPYVGSTYQMYYCKIESESVTKKVFAKCTPRSEQNNEGLTEFNHYRQFNKINTNPNIACPRPLDFIEDLNILLTEAVPGDNLHRIFKNIHRIFKKVDKAEIAEIIKLCALWLRTFHSIAKTAKKEAINERYFEDTIRYMRYLSDRQPYEGKRNKFAFSGKILFEIERVLNQLLLIKSKVLCEYANRNGDFGLSNIIIHDRAITVLDIDSNRIEPVAQDISAFLVAMELMPYLYLFSRKHSARYKSIFLQTYFQPQNIDAELRFVLSVYELQALLKSCMRHHLTMNRINPVIGKFASMYLQCIYRRKLSGVLFKIESYLKKIPII